MEKENDSQSCIQKESDKMNEFVAHSQSQEHLDSSSTSSLSMFADHNESHHGVLRTPDIIMDSPKDEDYPERESMDDALKSEKAFIEFVMSFPSKETSEHHRSADSMSPKSKSPTIGSSTTKVGLDHLDNLCKLMEQLGELRDTNCKLQKRVQYLEDLKTLHDMHKEINENDQYCPGEVVTFKTGPYELQKSATETHVKKKIEEECMIPNRSPSKYLSRRGRHQQEPRRERSKSVGHEDLGEDTKSRRIFPKWSKVKEAFGWESGSSYRKESVKIKERCPNSPRRRSDESRQMYRHPGNTNWYDECASLHSSLEDVHEKIDEDKWKRTSVASEKYVLNIPFEGMKRQKSTPSPGSDQMNYFKDNIDSKSKCSTMERESYKSQEFNKSEKDDIKRQKGPWGRVKTIIEKRRDSLKRRSLRRDYSSGDFDSAGNKNAMSFTEAIDLKNYNEFLESSMKQGTEEDTGKKRRNKPGPIAFEQEVDYAYPRTPSSSPTFHRKSAWTKVKKALKGKKDDDKDPMSLSTPASPEGQLDGNFTFDELEVELAKRIDNSTDSSRVGSDGYALQMSPTAPSDIMLQLQRNLSDDFNRKIQEWERIRGIGNVTCSPQCGQKPLTDVPRPRKKSERDDSKNLKPKLKDLAWLEKELQKIEKEKQRLSKERQKYEERALRLQKLRETMLTANTSNKREVLVKTSAGEFRFEGISDAFTKKLYEWETKRGLGPELSTIALLDSSRLVVQQSIASKNGLMQRVLSRSESSIADIGQPSHNSSNSLPSVKLAEGLELDRPNQSSRANSEPDLSTLVALKNGANVSENAVSLCTENLTEKEVTKHSDSKSGDEICYEKRRKDSETYYNLLEENVILLEQLKDKEEICGRLEKELEILDEKVDVMNARHIQETEHYRAKLWELHRHGTTPSDVIFCRQTMEQLKMRIDTLEKYTEKLKSDRETIEDSFRHHSKEQETMTLDLLEKMRELKAAGASKEIDSRESSQMETNTILRLQNLSALLLKQTQELESALSEKTRQICQLKWELLHRDLSTVKLQTELHSHRAHRKRSKFAHWRSRSSEEASVATDVQDSGISDDLALSANVYSCRESCNDIGATRLASTVQQLSKEVMKLTSNTDCLNRENTSQILSKANQVHDSPEKRRICRQSSIKDELKKITVRRSSADNLSLVPTREDMRKGDTSSEDSSDEYFTKVSWTAGTKATLPGSENERLLMSYGENPPRSCAQRRKKLQKVSKHTSNSARKRSNTFHTNRDLAKPNIVEMAPAKCHSFRITRKQIEDSVKSKPIDINLIRNLSLNLRGRDSKDQVLCPPKAGNSNAFKSDLNAKTLKHLFLREVSSDSKIPSLLQLQCSKTNEDLENTLSNTPTRSMSDKHKNENAVAKRESIQKRRLKKRLKSPESSNTTAESNFQTSADNVRQKLNEMLKDQLPRKAVNNHKDEPPPNNQEAHTEIPTITIQLPKKKMRKYSYSTEDTEVNEELSFTITMPKKRSLSSEQDSSSVSESSPRLSHSTEKSTFKSPSESPSIDLTSPEQIIRTNGNIRLLRLVSLDKFDSPFHNDEASKNIPQSEQLSQRKRKIEENKEDNIPFKDSETDTHDRSINDRQLKLSNSHDFTSHLHQNDSPNSCLKSPSAPQLDWRKVCAKKISRTGAPNVKSLIDKYNQKVIESQSPHTSNVSSPVSVRKTSQPTQPTCHSVVSSPIPPFFSTPNTPTINEVFDKSPFFTAPNFEQISKTPPSSPSSIARALALRKAREEFISSQTSLTLPPKLRSDKFQRSLSDNSGSQMFDDSEKERRFTKTNKHELNPKGDQDHASGESMDSINLLMLRAGENCQELRMPKRVSDAQKSVPEDEQQHNLKTSKSLSSSSLFKTVLNHDFKMPSSFLRLKKSKRKKDMGTVSQLCRQSLLLTDDFPSVLPSEASHKSCPSSPELKSKTIRKSNWFQRNIFKHK